MASSSKEDHALTKRWADICLEDEEEHEVSLADDCDEEEELNFDDRWCLVGRMLSGKVSDFQIFQNIIANLWKPGRGIFIKILDQNRHVGSNPRSAADSKRMGNKERPLYLGQCVESDPNNFQGVWRDYLRVRVRVNVNAPLKRRMKIRSRNGEAFYAYFKYERVPTFCFICGVMGHAERFCEKIYDTPIENIVKPYSIEIKAPTRQQSFLTASPWLRSGKGGHVPAKQSTSASPSVNAPTDFRGTNSVNCDPHDSQSKSRDYGNQQSTLKEHVVLVNDNSSDFNSEEIIEISDLNRKRLVTSTHVGPASMTKDLMEIEDEVVERFRIKIGFEGCFSVDVNGRKGGLAMLWRISEEAHLNNYSNNHIDIEVRIPGMVKWRLTGFYGEPNRNLRHHTWNHLRSMAADSSLPWCVIGDFNNIISQEDKKGGRPYPATLITGFQDAISDCHLIDLELRGYQFTWERSRGTNRAVEIRLDRAMATQQWLNLFNEKRKVGQKSVIRDTTATPIKQAEVAIDTGHGAAEDLLFTAEEIDLCPNLVAEEEARADTDSLKSARSRSWAEEVEENHGSAAHNNWKKFTASKSFNSDAKLMYTEPLIKGGRKIAQIDLEEVKWEEASWKSAVICMVMGANVPATVFEGFIRRVWGHLGILQVARMAKGLTMVKFNDEATRDEVLENRVIQFDRKPVIVRPWTSDLNAVKMVKSVVLWIRLHNLGLQYWGKNTLSALISTIGKPIMVDKHTKERTRVQFARVLVEMDIIDNPEKTLWFVNEFGQLVDQSIEYEWLPVECKHCGGFGHIMADCKREDKAVGSETKAKDQQLGPEAVTTTSNLSNASTEWQAPKPRSKGAGWNVRGLNKRKKQESVAEVWKVNKVGVGALLETKAWVILGDFNAVFHHDDRQGGNPISSTKLIDSNNWVAPASVDPMRRTGHFGSLILADHMAFKQIVLDSWSRPLNCSGLKGICLKTMRLKHKLKAFNSDAIGNIGEAYERAKDSYKEAQLLSQAHPLDQVYIIREQQSAVLFHNQDLMYFNFLSQRSKITWIQKGDNNTSYFHAMLKKRNEQNKIVSFVTDHGTLNDHFPDVVQHFLGHFRSIMGRARATSVEIQQSCIAMGPKLNLDQHVSLLKPFSFKEVRTAMFSIPSTKSPGPDGFGSGFFKSMWSEGIPLRPTKWRLDDCGLILKKMKQRLHSWTNKHLSYAGRIQLIQTTLIGLRNYWMSVFLLPQSVIKEIEKLCRGFLWGLKENRTRIHMSSWDKGQDFWSYNLQVDSSWYWRKLCRLRSDFSPTDIVSASRGGVFRATKLYNSSLSQTCDPTARAVWCSLNVPKQGFILWQVVQTSLLTRDMLGRFNIQASLLGVRGYFQVAGLQRLV
uniref:CCHC-type domain-containing protein n=1 Tax=Cannabis sativa TaxID=3483 RepID=A0A803P0P8_CANSA